MPNLNSSYSKEDDALILKCLAHSPNPSVAFLEAAKSLNRSYSAISNRYYAVLKKKFKHTLKSEGEIKASKAELKVTDFRPAKQQMKITVSNSTNTVANVIYKSDAVTVAKSGETVIIIENI